MLYLAFGLYLLLLSRLGLLPPLRAHRTARSFQQHLLGIGEEAEWDEHQRRRRRLAPVAPSLRLR